MYYPAVADGYWLMFTPLSRGIHTIVSRGVEHDAQLTVNLTYILKVEAGR
jgi:hypothetical protein